MTLLLTWVVPDGIVMGADSALTWTGPKGVEMTLSDAYKIIPCDRRGLKCGVSFCGTASIDNTWTSSWLRNYIANYGGETRILSLAGQLSTDLEKLDIGQNLLAVHVASWEQVGNRDAGDIEPRFLEVSNLNRSSGDPCLNFSVVDMLPTSFVADIKKYRNGDITQYPMRFGSAGIPKEFSTKWITDKLIPAQTAMIGVQVPQPHISSVAEYVRFLIGFVADTQRIARQSATVNRPIETLLLFPDYHEMFSTRY